MPGSGDPRGGNSIQAARRLGLAGDWARAAEIYARVGAALQAAQAYERAGDLRTAAATYERHFVESIVTGMSAAAADKNAALRAGQLYARSGQPDKALEVLVRGDHMAAAAGLAESLGRFGEAARLYTRAGALPRAAECWERAGDHVRAALARGEEAFQADRLSEAAAQYVLGQDYYRAAELYESLRWPAQAAEAYESGGAYAEAAEAYLRAGERLRAAEAFEKGGQFGRAAELFEALGERARAAGLFEQAGDNLKSGQAAAQAGDIKKAIAFLQRVAPDEPSHALATELLAQLFLRSGLPRLALERLQLALGDQAPAAETIGLHYWLAVCRETLGETRVALELFQKVLAIDFAYQDAAERVTRLSGGAIRAGSRPASLADAATLPPAAPAITPVAATAGGPVARPVTPAPRAGEPPEAPPVPRSKRASAPAGRAALTLCEPLGRGPLGELHRGQQNDGRSVAVRVFPAGGMAPEVLRPLLRDLAPATKLSHPNLVKVLGLVEMDGRTCLVTELVKGTNMGEFVRSGKTLSLKRCHALGRALALGLSYVHGKGLVHGSLRPSNVMVAGGVVKLADLGLGPLFRVLVAHDPYAAPENHLDQAGDIYAFGATLYHLLTGVSVARPPSAPSLASTLVPGIPKSFDQLLSRALARDPAERFASVKQIVKALDAMVSIG